MHLYNHDLVVPIANLFRILIGSAWIHFHYSGDTEKILLYLAHMLAQYQNGPMRKDLY